VSRALDQVGVFARTLDDLALALNVIAGHDPADPDTRPVAAPAFVATLNERPPLPPQFAFVRTAHWETLDGDAGGAFEQLVERLGPAVQPVDLPERFRETGTLHRAIVAADLAHSLDLPARKDGEGLGTDLKALVAEGRKVEAVRYLAALKQARVFGAGLAEVFTMYDAIITPATAGVAPIGDEATDDTAFCTLWTLVGLPALLLPVLQGEDGMPLGVQLIGQAGDDARLLRSARWLLETLGGKRTARSRRSQAR
jgi:Asp-tRNA(Asn)/Glu-tRNA(Gln) amidotransferase A subunit family amidase